MSKPPVAVDETAEMGCAFATRQRLLRSRSILARKSEPVLPSGHCDRPTLRAKNRCAEGSTTVEAPSAARPACGPCLQTGRRTSTGMRRLRVQGRSEPIGCIYAMEWAPADENKKKKRGEKIRRSVGRAALREQSPCERSRVDRKERVFPWWKRKSKIEAAWERCRARVRNGRCCNCRACRRALAPANGGADGMGGALDVLGPGWGSRLRPFAAHRGRWRQRRRAGR